MKSPTSCHDDITDCGVFVATVTCNRRTNEETVLEALITFELPEAIIGKSWQLVLPTDNVVGAGRELNEVEAKENWPRAYSAQPLAVAQACDEYSSEALIDAWVIDFITIVVPIMIETAVITNTDIRAMNPLFVLILLYDI